MNGSQIKKILYTDAATNQCFIGVFPSDIIPHYNNTYPAACVINTDTDGGPGEHWIAVYITSPEEVEFFDSFGRSPYEAPSVQIYPITFDNLNLSFEITPKYNRATPSSVGGIAYIFCLSAVVSSVFTQYYLLSPNASNKMIHW